MGTIKIDAQCNTVLLVLLDIETFDPHEMWEAPMSTVRTLLKRTKSKARARGALSVSEFKKHASRVWPS
jgi:hypothetical protein